jgi:RNA polymerase primary sigma factor
MLFMEDLPKLPLEKIRRILQSTLRPVSLDAPLGEDEDGSLQDIIPDAALPSPGENAMKQSLREAAERVMSTLTTREEKIVRMRFGIGYEDEHTLEEVGRHINLTRERIRQIEFRALQKLRGATRRRLIEDYAGG